MRDLLFIILTVLFAIAAFVARCDNNGFMMAIALYCLTAYWLLGKERCAPMYLGEAKVWMKFKLLLITTAYLIFNYFVLMKAMSMEVQAIAYATIWFSVTSGLLYLNCKKLLHNSRFSSQ